MRCSLLLIIFVFLSACSLDASIYRPSSLIDIENPPHLNIQRTEADFIAGEVVTTGNGAVVTGTFGEVSELQTLGNGVVIEGVFYE